MKLTLKILLFIFLTFLAIFFGLIFTFFVITKDAKLDKTKLVNMNTIITCYDKNFEVIDTLSNNTTVTTIDKIPNYVQKAFVSIEDKRFYSHNGIDKKALVRATLSNIASFSFKEGGSTISQQLIKNTHLTNEKTLKRKLIEIKLAKKLEKNFTKNQIMEMYLNTIYFGDNCYGITSASEYYFEKSPEDLTINEGAILASIIKSPSNYSPYHNNEKCFKRKNLVLKEMYNDGYITIDEYELNRNLQVKTHGKSQGKNYDYLSLVKKEINKYLENNPYHDNCLNVYTSFDPELQNIIKNQIDGLPVNTDKIAIIIDKNGNICAYYSTVHEIYRQMGSTAKPIFVYAPAIEKNVYDTCSLILDEKTDFNGYSPSNYNDKYYGYVSLKDSLSKSLNVSSVKVLSALGVENAYNYAKKYDIPISYSDKNLSLALGSTNKGATLKQITGAYTTFINDGYYQSPNCVNCVKNNKNSVVYSKNPTKTRIFSEDTAFLMNDMLGESVKSGTAKSLSYSKLPLCAKTGTVGNSKGNTDAYCISYSSEYVLGVWLGNADNSLMDNNLTGGGIPTKLSANVWSEICKDYMPPSFNKPDSIEELYVDKISYEQDKIVEIADNIAPNKFTFKSYFRKNQNNKRKSTRFSSPNIDTPKLSVNNKQIQISLCLIEYINCEIIREHNNKKEMIFDFTNQSNTFIDNNAIENENYTYYARPYYFDGKIKHYGKEILIGKIKAPISLGNGAWWDDDYNI